MFLNRRISFKVIFEFAWRVQLVAFLLSAAAYVAYHVFELKAIAIPFLPVATIGTAVAFYVGFKNNSAYDRLWEARRIWGSITNASRMWAAMVADLIASRQEASIEVDDLKKTLLYKHLAWMNMLRLQLRRTSVFSEAEYVSSTQLKIIRKIHGEHKYDHHVEEVFLKFLSPGEQEEAKHKTNVAAHLLHQQNTALIQCKNRGWLDEYEHSDMSKIILELYNQQGASERIKVFLFPGNTPISALYLCTSLYHFFPSPLLTTWTV